MSLARQYTKQAVFLLSTYITIFSFERKFTAVIYNWETAVFASFIQWSMLQTGPTVYKMSCK